MQIFQHIQQYLGASIDRERLQSLLSQRGHAFGFSDSRALYINSRVRMLALLFAILTPLWIPIDYLLLDSAQFQLMAVVRLFFSLMLLMLSGVPDQDVSLRQAHNRLFALMVMPAVFHLASLMILASVPPSDYLICYSFLPFLIIVMHSVFPLTLFEGVRLALLSITLLSLGPMLQGSLWSFGGFANMWLMCLLMGVALWTQISQLQMKIQLFEEATTDPLTGLLNRRTLMNQLVHIRRLLLRNGRPVALLMMDLDHFKQINDRFGHQVGDKVLKVFSNILQTQVRSSDYVARFGGEEFLVVLPEARTGDAVLLAERILNACRGTSIELPDQTKIGFSLSIGVGRLDINNTVEASLSSVDAALYRAKQEGRDRYVAVDSTFEAAQYDQLLPASKPKKAARKLRTAIGWR
ncbi:sensor domain-containing diguanylate cyclase [Motiliproteus coralliicola]|uniref:diguanylate cyclase n=1 Tax=Motiliproteus coralliicola TaxID=2283196 RepID=A0A369WMC7_9GAMM|nr:diguanylate cyclase [Motiliproteus coralliicola]RDE22837.1 sensor domain-containing diguanylate cyclase [Motiliproteus coralliicola]